MRVRFCSPAVVFQHRMLSLTVVATSSPHSSKHVLICCRSPGGGGARVHLRSAAVVFQHCMLSVSHSF